MKLSEDLAGEVKWGREMNKVDQGRPLLIVCHVYRPWVHHPAHLKKIQKKKCEKQPL